MPEVGFLLLVAMGFAALAYSARRRRVVAARWSDRLGMAPRRDLSHLPEELQRTALWALCDGGVEHSVVGGQLSLAAHDIDVTVFVLEGLRRRRNECAVLDVEPPFLIDPEVTVVVCRLPVRAVPHVLIKRVLAGPGGDELPALHGVAGFARRTQVAWVDPPRSIGREPVIQHPSVVPSAGRWVVWSSDADATRALIGSDPSWLRQLAYHDVIEIIGSLVVVYTTGGALDDDGVDDYVAAATAVCERVLSRTPELAPRGVVG